MSRQRLIEEIRRRGGPLGEASVASAAVDAVIDGISTLARGGDKVILRGFGTFEQKTRAGRKGRNIRTGEEITIAPRTAISFKPAKG